MMTQIPRDWNPQKTWLLAVGILEWENENTWSAFPDAVKGRFDEKLVELLSSTGIPDEQILYLQDGS